MRRSNLILIAQIAFVVLVLAAISFISSRSPQQNISPTPSSYVSAAAQPSATSSESVSVPQATTTAPAKATTTRKASIKATESASATPDPAQQNIVTRLESPYAEAPLPFTSVNDRARAATVNILCTTSGGLLRPISGSGIFIDPRGVILTNAHVAQYVLLAESGRSDLICTVRTGSPAVAHWVPRVMFVPPVWVQAHAHEIIADNVTGTGEHDYALLVVAGSLNGEVRPAAFPYLSPDTREAIGFVGDRIIASSYPAEFLGGLATESNLYAASSITHIQKLMTFSTTSIDVISIGGVISAQSGSSGGAVVNAWGRLIGLISTMSNGVTTSDRDLRAVTLSYINRDLKAQSGTDLDSVLKTVDPIAAAKAFAREIAPQLTDLLIKEATKAR